MGICVKNEVGQLKKVMLHRPGRELEQLVPHTLERLLFDDIPYLKRLRRSMTALPIYSGKTGQKWSTWKI